MINNITLPDGTETTTYSKDYMFYCEALSLSKKDLNTRRHRLFKMEELNQLERLDKVKYWLNHIWYKKKES